MGWFENLRKSLGLKQKSISDLSEKEMNDVIREIRLNTRKIEQKMDQAEKELQNIASEILKSTKLKGAILMEKLRQKKAIMSFYVKAYIMASRNASGMESILEIRKLMGTIDKKMSGKLEALSPANISAFLQLMNDEMSKGQFDTDDIMTTLENFTESINTKGDTEAEKIIGELQDMALLDDEKLTEAEKIKRIIDMA